MGKRRATVQTRRLSRRDAELHQTAQTYDHQGLTIKGQVSPCSRGDQHHGGQEKRGTERRPRSLSLALLSETGAGQTKYLPPPQRFHPPGWGNWTETWWPPAPRRALSPWPGRSSTTPTSVLWRKHKEAQLATGPPGGKVGP